MGAGKVLGVAAGVAVLAGAGYWAAGHYMGQGIARDLDAVLAQAPAGVKITHGAVSFSPLTRTLHIDGLSVSSAAFQVQAATVDAKGLSLGALGLSFQSGTAVGTMSEQDTLPIVGHVAIGKITVTAEGMEQSFALTEAENIRFRPWVLRQPGTPSWDSVKAAYDELVAQMASADPATSVDRMTSLGPTLARAAGLALLAVDYDSFVYTDINGHFTTPSPATNSTVVVTAHYDRAASTGGLHDGVYGAMEMTGLTESLGPQGTIRMAKFSFAGADMRAPARALLQGAPLDEAVLNGLSVGAMTVSGLSANPPNGYPFQLDSLATDPMMVADGRIAAGGIVLQGLQVDPRAATDPQAAAAIKAMGLTKLTMGLAVHYQWDFQNSALTVERTSVKVDELGELALDATIHGAAPAQPLQQLFQSAQLDKAQLRYADHSLIDRLLRATATQQGKQVEDVRGQVAAMVQANGALLGATPRGKPLVTAVESLVRKPGNLILTANPPEPVPLTVLFSGPTPEPAAVIDALGLAATTGQ
ncbi:hypothetical protein [Azospirillum sp. B4]|uniref:hypothetical protein n=1 Tax=Azospirillum sp. B4 TaxID=95605 RepID=UPI0003475213|nr:hypothetical protein [Azospirillum sp. B4]